MMILLMAAMLSLSACGSSKDAETTAPAEDMEQETNGFYDVVSYEELTSKVIKLGEYKGLEAEKTVVEVTDETVQDEIWQIKKQYAVPEDVERAADLRDITVIDFTGYVDGETSEGMQGTEYALELGSGNFIPGFEEQLVGAVAGQDVEVHVTFPEDYYEEMAGKPVVFTVTVNKVYEIVMPEVNDAFVARTFGYATVEEAKAALQELKNKERFAEQAKNIILETS